MSYLYTAQSVLCLVVGDGGCKSFVLSRCDPIKEMDNI